MVRSSLSLSLSTDTYVIGREGAALRGAPPRETGADERSDRERERAAARGLSGSEPTPDDRYAICVFREQLVSRSFPIRFARSRVQTHSSTCPVAFANIFDRFSPRYQSEPLSKTNASANRYRKLARERASPSESRAPSPLALRCRPPSRSPRSRCAGSCLRKESAQPRFAHTHTQAKVIRNALFLSLSLSISLSLSRHAQEQSSDARAHGPHTSARQTLPNKKVTSLGYC